MPRKQCKYQCDCAFSLHIRQRELLFKKDIIPTIQTIATIQISIDKYHTTMAIVNLEVPFAEIHGTLVRNGIIHCQQKYKDDTGNVIFESKQVKRLSRTERKPVA